MVKYTWVKNKVPNNLEIKQVYGIAFSEDMRVLLRLDNTNYKLTGGKPEQNEIFEETLKREYIEEVNVELDEIYYLGYLLVEEDNSIPYAQVRMIAKIIKINDKKTDPDNGKIYGRKLVNVNNLKKYLNYSDEAGNLMLDDAINMANKNYIFAISNNDEEFI